MFIRQKMHTQRWLHTFISSTHSTITVHRTLDIFPTKCLKWHTLDLMIWNVPSRGHAPDRFVNHSSLCQFVYHKCVRSLISQKKAESFVTLRQNNVFSGSLIRRIHETFPLSRTNLMGLLWNKTAIIFWEFFSSVSISAQWNFDQVLCNSFLLNICSSELCSAPKQTVKLSLLWGHGCASSC